MNDPRESSRANVHGGGLDAGLGGSPAPSNAGDGVGCGPFRIGIDVRALRMPGIGRHVRELVSAIAEVNTVDRFFLYCDSESSAAPFRDRWPNVRTVMIGSPLYSVSEQLWLPPRILLDRLDLFHAPTSLMVPLICPCPLVVTVHDLLLKSRPEHLPSRLAGLYFRVMNEAALRSAKQLLTVSDFTRNELVSAYPRYAGKTKTVHNGVGPAFRPARDDERLRNLKKTLGVRHRYALYVGTYKKHKNVPVLIEAFANLGPPLRAGLQLLLLGQRDPRFPEAGVLISRLGLQDDVIQAERVEEQDLIALYSGAEVVVASSAYEGFGFSVLEAMACGTPVVATRIPAFMEVAGDAALYAEPGDCDGMAAALARLLQEPGLRDRLVAAGLQRSAGFSWRRAAVETLAAYRKALAPGRTDAQG